MDAGTRRIAWTSAVIHGLIHASVLLLPTLLPQLKQAFGVSLLAVLGLANAMYLLFGLAAIPAGYLADRFGSRTVLLAAAGGSAAALLVAATAQSFTALAIGLVALGFFAGIYHPSGLSLVSRRVAAGERGRAIGIHGVGGNVGEALAPTWAALFASQLGWRWGFASAGLLAAACGLLALTLPADPHAHGPATPVTPPRAFPSAAAALLKSRPLRWLLLGSVASGLVYRGVLTFLPLHLSDSAGGVLNASYLTSLVLLAGIVAQRMGGELADRLPRERLFLAEVALFAPVLVLLGLSSGTGLVVCAVSFGFLWYLSQPLSSALAAAHADTRDHGLLYGLQFSATFAAGSFATTLGGLLAAQGGTSMAFLGFGAVAVAQLFAVFMLVRSARRSAPAFDAIPERA